MVSNGSAQTIASGVVERQPAPNTHARHCVGQQGRQRVSIGDGDGIRNANLDDISIDEH